MRFHSRTRIVGAERSAVTAEATRQASCFTDDGMRYKFDPSKTEVRWIA
jgi:hypothetical protein